jgi:hypothetical protein
MDLFPPSANADWMSDNEKKKKKKKKKSSPEILWTEILRDMAFLQ